MRKLKVVFCFIAFITIFNDEGSGQVFNIMPPGKHQMYFNLGIDPIPDLTIGYARSFHLFFINRQYTLLGDVKIPISLPDLVHYRVQIAVRVPVVNFSNWYIINKFGILSIGTENSIYTGYNISLDETVLFGYFVDKWHVSSEIGYTNFILTSITHSKWYKQIHYAEARDGWYLGTGGSYTFGAHGGYKINDSIEFTGRLIMKRTQRFNSIEGPPLYGNIGLNFYF